MIARKNPKRLTYEEAKLKAAGYCSYQERCQKEVVDKLYSYGLNTTQVNELLSYLITENFINEERFSKAYAGGKFRIKQWGRIRIQRELEKRKISEYCIRKGLEEIDEEDYQSTANKIIQKKSDQLSTESHYLMKKRIAAYAINKGYEPSYIWELINFYFEDNRN